MILGMTPFTFFHVALSLIGIATGFVVLFGLIGGKLLRGINGLFLTTTVLTSITGFGFQVDRFMPSHAVGILSLVLLAIALRALYRYGLAGRWRTTYVITAMIALYLNVFVLIVQAFLKVPALHELAPTQAEPPFAIAQGVNLVAFILLITLAARAFRGEPERLA